MTDPITPTAPPTPSIRSNAQYFSQFTALGIAVAPPTFATTRKGGHSASFAIQCQDGRLLDLLMFDNNLSTLKQRVSPITVGAILHAQGAIRPPRPTHREFHTFVAERLTVITPGNNRHPE